MNPNKRKILNDPVYGFITIPDDLLYDIIEHPYFQRLRRIQQLGLLHYVYPGALHTRFHHAIGAMYLMDRALELIRTKGTQVSDNEHLSAALAILLHDIGHGPFSHALENSIVTDISHEHISLVIMQHLNEVFNGNLSKAIDIFQGQYDRVFFNQLVSGQLDVDRLDYLTRDSFYTGVSEGIVGTERIIKMMNVHNNELVIEEKGIYSIEKFLISRQLMYWQVYLHKTVISAEIMLINVLKRAQTLSLNGTKLSVSKQLKPFLEKTITKEVFLQNPSYIHLFCQLDDFDIISSIKEWQDETDIVLKELSQRIINRRLFRTIITDEPIDNELVSELKASISKFFHIHINDSHYFIHHGTIDAQAYDPLHNPINILYRNGTIKDVTQASSTVNLGLISGQKTKHYLTFPKEVETIITNLSK